jgi:hypothetical protein
MPTFNLCADFMIFPDNFAFPPAPSNFVLAAYNFKQLGGANPMFVNQTLAERGLQFPHQGMRVALPVPITRITLRLGTFAGAVDIKGYDSAGNLVLTRTAPYTNSYKNLTLISRRKMAYLEFKEGNNEGILVKICAKITA